MREVPTFGGISHFSSFGKNPTLPQSICAQEGSRARCRSDGMAGFPMSGHAAVPLKALLDLVRSMLPSLGRLQQDYFTWSVSLAGRVQ